MSEENYNENGCFTHEYPYTSHRELNLDWLIKLVQSKKVKDIEVTTNADNTYTVVITYADATTATLNLASTVNLQEIYAIIEQQAILRRLYVVNYGSTNFSEINDAFTEGRVMACKKGTDLFFYDSKKAVYHDGAYYTRYTFKGLSEEKKTMYITVEQHTQTLAVSWAFTETALQEELVSGTNIKTINGNSVLGSGNIVIATGVSWGGITGTLSNQSDLSGVLEGKVEKAVVCGNYNTSSTYNAGDFCWHNNGLYMCNTNNTTGEWDSTKWNEKTLGEGIGDFAEISGQNAIAIFWLKSDVASDYSNSSTYNVGDYCLHSNVLYKCNTQISVAEEWNSGHWTSVKITNELKSKQDALISGTNIKTINGNSVLGSGDLEIQTSPLTVASSLPTADETEYNKHLLYDSADEIKYIKQISTSIVPNTINDSSGKFYSTEDSQSKRIIEKNGVIYLFTNNFTNIKKYNIQNNTVTTLSTGLSGFRSGNEYGNIVFEYNNKIYLGGTGTSGYNATYSIYEVDLDNNTYTLKLNYVSNTPKNCAIKTDKYLRVFNVNPNGLNLEIDLDTFSYTTKTTKTDLGWDTGYIAFYYDNKVYLLNCGDSGIHQYGTATYYNITNNTWSSNFYLSYNFKNACSYQDETGMYIIGGSVSDTSLTWNNSNKIYKFNGTDVEEFGTLTETLVNGQCIKVNNILYVFCGTWNGTNNGNARILEENKTYKYNTLQTYSFIPVSTLPTANATEYAKHLMYLDTTDNKLKYIVESSGTYSYNTIG